jgi:hypothetical protein
LKAIPEEMYLNELYHCVGDEKPKYVFRGMICYIAAHYLAFFRRMVIKLDY